MVMLVPAFVYPVSAQTGSATALEEVGHVNEIGIATRRPISKADEETKLVSFLHAEITFISAFCHRFIWGFYPIVRRELGGMPRIAWVNCEAG